MAEDEIRAVNTCVEEVTISIHRKLRMVSFIYTFI